MPKPFSMLTGEQTVYWIYNYIYGTGPFWFYIAVSTIASLIPDIIFKVIDNILEKKIVAQLKLKELKRMKEFEQLKKLENLEEKENNRKKKVRVFYVPTTANRIFQTKVKDEPIDEKNIHLVDQNSIKRDTMFRKSFQVQQRF